MTLNHLLIIDQYEFSRIKSFALKIVVAQLQVTYKQFVTKTEDVPS